MRIRADPVKDRQDAFGLRQQRRWSMSDSNCRSASFDTQAIVFRALFEQYNVALLPGKAFEYLHELGRRGIERVIEGGFVNFGSAVVSERFLSQIYRTLLDVQIIDREVFRSAASSADLLADGRTDLEGLRPSFFFELANFVGGFPRFGNLDLDEFRCAAFEYPAVTDGDGVGGCVNCRDKAQREN